MSDDRLFASNNAIGRKWYFLNIIILAVITYITKVVFATHIIPNVTTDVYYMIANGILYFLYGIYLVTFFALIDRRLYDISGRRDANSYKNISAILKLAVFVQILYLYCLWKHPQLPISYEQLYFISIILNFIFISIVFVIGLFKGKISNLSYEEYKRKIKYD